MKWITIFVMAIMLVGITQLGFSAEQPDGLMGMKWGESIEQCKERILCISEIEIDKESIMVFGKRSSIGDIVIPTVIYDFNKNRLRGVFLIFMGNTNFRKIRLALMDKYGKPLSTDMLKNSYNATIGVSMAWDFSDVRIVFNYNTAKDEGEIYYKYKPLFEEDTKKKIKEFEKTKKGL